MAKQALLPCPFCGGEAEMDTQQGFMDLQGRMRLRIAIYCTNCPADVGMCYDDCNGISDEQVIPLWNRRAVPVSENAAQEVGRDDCTGAGSNHCTEPPAAAPACPDAALADRLASYIPDGDEYNGEYAKTLTAAVAALRALTPPNDGAPL